MGTIVGALRDALEKIHLGHQRAEEPIGVVEEGVSASIKVWKTDCEAQTGRPVKWPLGEMGVGETLLLPFSPSECHCRTSYWADKNGFEYKIAKTDGGSNVTRVA